MQVEFEGLGVSEPALRKCLVCYAVVHHPDVEKHREWHKEPHKVNLIK